MPTIAFADESGTDANSPCYGIGVVCVSADAVDAFETYVKDLKAQHGVQGEIKWTRIRTSHGAINFALGALDAILRSHTATLDVMVVRKDQYRNWRGDTEVAFYKTYTQLLRHIARRTQEPATVLIDARSDAYSRSNEVIETIGNRMLARLNSSGRLTGVEKVDSRERIGIQVADVLTGAITAGHVRYLDRGFGMHNGKLVTIGRIAQMLGWDALCYDTFPHDKINIWHFPIEFRADPETRNPQPTRAAVPYVTADDLR
jgi:hypothetical protein